MRTGAEVRTLHHHEQDASTASSTASGGTTARVPVDAVLSTMPLRHLVASLSPPAPDDVRAAADQLHYRDFLTVALIVDKADVFPDNWIYVHDPGVKLGRIQNFKNWSADLVPDPAKTCLGLEYFCFEGDGLWTMPDADLIALGRTELARIGLVDPRPGRSTARSSACRRPIPSTTPATSPRSTSSATTCGRSRTSRWPAATACTATTTRTIRWSPAMLAARSLMGHDADAWTINADDEYHETGELDLGTDLRDLLGTQPLVPLMREPGRDDTPIASPAPERLAG